MDQARPAPISVVEIASPSNFDACAYLAANPDVAAAAVKAGFARQHFEAHGHAEGRYQLTREATESRRRKMDRLSPHLRQDMEHQWRYGIVDYLTPALRISTGISNTDAVSAMGYDPDMLRLIQSYPDGLVLDCGAGFKNEFFDNLVNFEIVAYPSTDVLGVGERLPFRDNTFDAIMSVAVLEHVRDPFQCAREISRVLKPGGELYCAMPFLQPYHGYPHHYFNATGQGLRRLFADSLTIIRQDIHHGMKPLATLQWILNSWAAGLSPAAASDFRNMTVGELLSSYDGLMERPFCCDLSQEKIYELACATAITATKPF